MGKFKDILYTIDAVVFTPVLFIWTWVGGLYVWLWTWFVADAMYGWFMGIIALLTPLYSTLDLFFLYGFKYGYTSNGTYTVKLTGDIGFSKFVLILCGSWIALHALSSIIEWIGCEGDKVIIISEQMDNY